MYNIMFDIINQVVYRFFLKLIIFDNPYLMHNIIFFS